MVMATSMHRIAVGTGAYTNVSEGNLNCYLFIPFGKRFKIITVGIEPTGADPYIEIGKPTSQYYDGFHFAFGIDNLVGEDEIWVEAIGGDSEVIVVRGELHVVLGSG